MRRLLFVLVVLAVAAPPALAQAPPRPALSFAETTVALTPGESSRVTILNDTSQQRRAQIRIGDMHLKAQGGADVSTAVTVEFPPRVDVPAGGERDVAIAVKDRPLEAGRYEGRLTVFDDESGTVSRIPVTLDTGPASAKAVKPAVESISVDAARNTPWASASKTVAVPLDVRGGEPELQEGDVVGVVVAGDDSGPVRALGLARLDSGVPEARLLITNLSAAAEYAGTVDFTPGADGGTVKLTVKVSDHWAWASLALLAGLGLALALRRWTGAVRPALVLEARAADLAAEPADSAIAAFKQAAQGHDWAAYDPSPALHAEVEAAKALIAKLDSRSFDEVSPEDRKAIEARLERIAELQATITALGPALAALEAAVTVVRKLAPITAIPTAPAPPAFVASADALLDGGDLKTLEAFAALKDSALAMTKLAARWPQLHAETARAMARLAGRTDVEEARQGLAGAWLQLSEASAPDVVEERKLLTRFADALARVAEETAAGAARQGPPAALGGVGTETAPPALAGLFVPTLGDIIASLPASPYATREQLFQAIRLGDTMRVALMTVVALWTGLEALYFGKTFGGFTDYVTAILWGTVVATGTDLVATAMRSRVGGVLPIDRA